MLIDTHTHIYSEQFDEDRSAMVERALQNGVERFYLPAIDSTYMQRMLEVEKEYPENVKLMMGLHPTSVKENYKEELEFVKEWLDKRDFAAVGEIGMDLYWDKTFIKEQQDAFSTQIDWAKEKKLPIIIHTRDSFPETFEILEEKNDNDLYGIFHCFSGGLEEAKHAIDLGFVLGIGGVVTFKNGKIDKFLKEIDLQHIVLETDAPYLAPTPNRGKRNEPAFIPLIVDKLCYIYDMTSDEIKKITTENALRVFK